MQRACWLVLLAAVLEAQPAGVEIPAGGVPMLAAATTSFRFLPAFGAEATYDVVNVEGLPFTSAARVTVKTAPSVPWGVQLLADTSGDVEQGDVLLMTAWVRGESPDSESGEARAVAYLQHNGGDFEKLGSLDLRAGREWRQVIVPFRSAFRFSGGQHNFAMHIGFSRQTLEFGGLQLINYGSSRTLAELPRTPMRWQGMEPDAPWRKEAAERIDRYRKEDFRVRVVDAAGKPVEGAKVHFAMQRHAFGFGSAVTAQLLNAASADGERYRAIVEKYFTKVVFENDLKWSPWEVGKSNTDRTYRRQWVDAALAWLAQRKIGVRGHYVCWAPIDSSNGTGGGPLDTLQQRLFAHMEGKLPAIGSGVMEWDAVNHIAGWGNPTIESLYGTAIFAEVFIRARGLVPEGVGLWVNEGQILAGGARRDDYERLIRRLLEDGATVDGIGFMGHFEESSLAGMDELYRTMERFAGLVPNLQLTELDVNSTDEAMQAAYLRDVMTLAFSHPAFRGIVMWGFWEASHWKPDAALWRRDWSLKPNGEAWIDLVTRQWWTDVEVETGEDGVARTRAFLGDYQVLVKVGERTAAATAVLGKGAGVLEIRIGE